VRRVSEVPLDVLKVGKWIRSADLSRLENAVYAGRGEYVASAAAPAWNDDVRAFIKTVPNIQVRERGGDVASGM